MVMDLATEMLMACLIFSSRYNYNSLKYPLFRHATEAELRNSPGIRALAGPMTPEDASRFVRSVTPSRSKRNPMKFTQDQKTRAAILKDHEKGIEKIARVQAEMNGFSWIEKWDFLSDSYVNLQTTDGLERLEAHLATKMAEKMENDENRANLDDTIDDISSKFSSLSVSNGIYLGWFSRLRIRAPLSGETVIGRFLKT